MKIPIRIISLSCLLILTSLLSAQETNPVNQIPPDPDAISIRMPDHIMPVLGCWFWRNEALAPQGYKQFIDQVSIHSPFDVLVQSLRAYDREVTDDAVYRQIKLAAEYAVEKGIRMTVDLDPRLARRAFQKRYPDELQEMLILQEVELSGDGSIETVIRSKDLIDHYTGNTTNYISLHGSLTRVYTYDRQAEEIESGTLMEITDHCVVAHASKDSMVIRIPAEQKKRGSRACVMVSFTHLSADVFAPHLLEFQREIIQKYKDLPVAGISKDEWGFPPAAYHTINEFWYSKHRAKAYAARTGGRDLISDCLLMYLGVEGQERERQMAINHFRDMSLQRNGAIENDFYLTAKKVFGEDAMVLVHPTWYPFPGFREFKKNGLDWWIATRDWAQTDELTPFAARTSLSKKWDGPLWYNMYYSDKIPDYEHSVWAHALAGGRINYHRPYPAKMESNKRDMMILRGNLMQAESRVRLLNYITQTPLDCPVAVIFGHACAMNWAGPGYNDVGMELVDSLWRAGIPTDLIPSGEIENGSLKIDKDGWIRYGEQQYQAAVLYHPEFEKKQMADFFNSASIVNTHLFRMGDWTKDFNGNPVNGNALLPSSFTASDDIHRVLSEIKNILTQKQVPLQTPATYLLEGFNHTSSSPPSTGHCRLIDGTVIHVAGTENVSGDPIKTKFNIGEHKVTFDAMGVAAVRLDEEGHVMALAAGGLRSFKTGEMHIQLEQRMDLAFWTNEAGQYEGVIQGWEEEIPSHHRSPIHQEKKFAAALLIRKQVCRWPPQ